MQFSVSILLLATSVAAHGAIVAAVGNADMKSVAQAVGIDNATPRDGTRREPFQRDSSIIRDRDIAAGTTEGCGRTLAGGPNKMSTAMTAAETSGAVARVRADGQGQVTMTLHQVNGDGAGPYTCQWTNDGKNFTPLDITTNVPGENSRSRAKATDFPLTVNIPAGTVGGMGANNDMGYIRCRNAARAGPFGGCVPTQIVQ